MRKSELEKLRTLNATPAMIRKLKEPGENRRYDGKINIEKYHLAARCQNLSGILKISICTGEDIRKKVYTPKWDVFINYAGDEYISRERQKDGSYTWRKAYISNLEDFDWYKSRWDHYMYMSNENAKTVQAILKTIRKGYDGICEWQQACKERKTVAEIKQKKERWAEEMQPVKDPPKGFEDWWKHNAFDGENYIFYASAKATEGYCTSCIGKVPLTIKPQHNMSGRCPVCKKKITYISRGMKTAQIWTRERATSCIQKYKNGLVQRDFAVRRVDTKDDLKTNISEFTVREYRRTVITEEGSKTYIWTDYRRRGMCWAKDEWMHIEKYNENMYRKNLSQLFKNVHSAYPIAMRHGYKAAGVRYYLTMEKKYPAIEMAYKAGLYTLAADMLDKYWLLDNVLNNQATGGLAKVLEIDNARMKRLKEKEGDIRGLLWLQEEKKRNTIFRDCDIKTLSDARIEPETVKRSHVGKYQTIEKICNYLNRQAKLRLTGSKHDLESTWRDWNDYVSMMEKLKMDCSKELLLKPKDLIIAHNELVATISMLKSEEEIAKKKKQFPGTQKLLESRELDKYEYSDGTFRIISPTSIDDIYREGITLKHCIHTCDIYFQRIEIRETYLLFLRRCADPSTPWYTIEIEPGGNIRQKKSVLNEAYKDLEEAMPFLRKWQSWVKKNLSERDRKLAEKSDKARKEGYAQLRKDKKIIWHGSLQGTLLADALENDFMEVI